MKSALLSVAWNADNWTFDALKAHYHTLVRYLNLQDQGMVLGQRLRNPLHDARPAAILSRPASWAKTFDRSGAHMKQ